MNGYKCLCTMSIFCVAQNTKWISPLNSLDLAAPNSYMANMFEVKMPKPFENRFEFEFKSILEGKQKKKRKRTGEARHLGMVSGTNGLASPLGLAHQWLSLLTPGSRASASDENANKNGRAGWDSNPHRAA